VVNFGLVLRLGDSSLDVVALGSGVRVEESVDTLERKETSFGNEEVYEWRCELLTVVSATWQRSWKIVAYDKDTAKEEVGLCGDRVQSNGHDSNDGECAEPLPHQTDGHGDCSVSDVEDLGDEGERDPVMARYESV
jgi:hypothetical protein